MSPAGYLVLHQSSVIRTSGPRGFSIQTRDALLNFMAEHEVGVAGPGNCGMVAVLL
jgi:hypothetical protein